MVKIQYHCPFFLLLLIIHQALYARSILRPVDQKTSRIETRWAGQNKPFYTLRDSHLEEYSLFKTFNRTFFFDHLLPKEKLSFRYKPEKSVDGAILEKMINAVLKEVEQKKKTYKDFIILRNRDFNRKKKSGLLILKCKHYPFVVKIFIENPQSFIMHKSKGFVPTFIFYMAGGINRHLLGFTRIKNLEDMQQRIAKNPRWANKVTMPRKWFLLPQKNRWIKISGFNIGKKKKQEIEIPGVYCVVSDWVDAERIASVFNKNDRKTCMELCNFLELAIDPHIDNFMFERNTNKIAIVDTEHFLSVVGMKKKKQFTSYFWWGMHLSGLAFNEMFLRTKKARREAQFLQRETELKYDIPTDKFHAPCA